ncbi:MAG: hypothetical protein ABIO70_31650 [Pseudomonadota bacterium]
MRLPIFLFSALLLGGCDQIPALRNLLHKGSRIKRVSEKRDVDCEARKGRPPRDGCVTGTIACGEEVEGNTAGGKDNFRDDFYVGKYCQAQRYGYPKGERVYNLQLPANTGANIWLDSDCADLDLFAFRWAYDGNCPTVSHTVSECEADGSVGDGVVHVETVANPAAYMIVVDGKAGAEGAFRLTVECGESR